MGVSLSKSAVSEGKLLQVVEAHNGRVECLSVNEDSTLLATGGQDGLVRVWSPRVGDQPCEPLLELGGHGGRITCIAFCDDSVVTASTDKTVRRWSVVDGRQLFVCVGHQSVVTRLICTGDFIFSSELHLFSQIPTHSGLKLPGGWGLNTQFMSTDAHF